MADRYPCKGCLVVNVCLKGIRCDKWMKAKIDIDEGIRLKICPDCETELKTTKHYPAKGSMFDNENFTMLRYYCPCCCFAMIRRV